jgi:NAD(P)-dependent dehydrogenase (short-subunit alcohol dehydrogenase family)
VRDDAIEIRRRQEANVQTAIDAYGRALEGKVAVVTGAARGIGRSYVEALLRAGMSVVGTDKTWAGSEEFEKQLGDDPRALAIVADVSDDGALDRAYAEVMGTFGRVDVLVNNAGLVSETLFAPHGHVKLLETADSDWLKMFGVNVFGTIKVIRRFVVPMREAGHGSIINLISSGVGLTNTGGSSFGGRPWTVEMPYQSSKSALMTAGFYLAQELFEETIAVNSIMPGHTRASWFDATARSFLDEAEGVYFLRPLVPEHLIPIVLFLSTQAATQNPVTCRVFSAPDWNYEHGFGDYRAWLDYDMPEDVERSYAKLEAALPKYWRAGFGRAPFDAEWVAFKAALEKLALIEHYEKGGSG